MPKNSKDDALDRVCRLAAIRSQAYRTDGELLQSFVEDRDEGAFAVLVERHGAMVRDVCMRVLQDPHDADDACQAAFLVLARKAAEIRKHGSVGSWLHCVARRVSATLLRDRISRQRREKSVAVAGSARPEHDAEGYEVRAILDEEIGQLPERYRAAIVLCYLEGQTRDEASQALDLSAGRLHGLLQRGRALLRERLSARGLAPSVALLGTLAAGNTGATVLPPTLAVRTVEWALAVPGSSQAAIDPVVLSVSEEACRVMSLAKMKTVFGLVCVGLVVALIGGVVCASVWSGPEKSPEVPGKRQPVGKDEPAVVPEVKDAGKPLAIALPKLSWPSAAVSQDGRIVVAPLGSPYRSVRIDLRTGKRTPVSGNTSNLVFAPDGKTVLTGNGILWDMETGKKIRWFRRPGGRVCCARFSPDFQYVITGEDKTVRVWDARTGKELAELVGQKERLTGVALAPRNQLAIGSSLGGEVRIWDWRQGKVLHMLVGHKTNSSISATFALGGRRAVTVGWNEKFLLWDTETGKPIPLRGGPNRANDAVVSPDGERVVTYDEYRDPIVRIWDAKDGALLHSLKHPKPVQAVGFDGEGVRLVTVGGEASIWDAKTGQRIVPLKDAKELQYIHFSPDGKRVVGASKDSHGVWDATTGERLKEFDATDQSLREFVVTPDGWSAIIAGFQYPVAVWDLATGKRKLLLKTGHSWQIPGLAFSPDGSRIAAASTDGTARLWDGKTGELVAVMKGHDDRVQSIRFSHSGKYVFTGSGANVNTGRIWDGKTGKLVVELRGHTDKVMHARFSRDEKRVLTGARDNTARLWDVATGKELHKFGHGSTITSIQFSPNQQSILTASSGLVTSYWTTPDGRRLNEGIGPTDEHSAKLWDAETGKLRFHLKHPAGVYASFTPDGEQFVTVSQGQIKYWSVAFGKSVATFRDTGGKKVEAVFSPDRRYLVVLMPNAHAELWSIVARKKLRAFDVGDSSDSFFAGNNRTFHSLTREGQFRSWRIDDPAQHAPGGERD